MDGSPQWGVKPLCRNGALRRVRFPCQATGEGGPTPCQMPGRVRQWSSLSLTGAGSSAPAAQRREVTTGTLEFCPTSLTRREACFSWNVSGGRKARARKRSVKQQCRRNRPQALPPCVQCIQTRLFRRAVRITWIPASTVPCLKARADGAAAYGKQAD